MLYLFLSQSESDSLFSHVHETPKCETNMLLHKTQTSSVVLYSMQDERQYNACAVGVTTTRTMVRGNCIGIRGFNLILNIEAPSSNLPSDLRFTEGTTVYLTSKQGGWRAMYFEHWYDFTSIERDVMPFDFVNY